MDFVQRLLHNWFARLHYRLVGGCLWNVSCLGVQLNCGITYSQFSITGVGDQAVNEKKSTVFRKLR